MAVTICGKISANVGVNCDNPLQAGAEDTLILINYEDWLNSTITLNVTNNQIIEAITLPSGVVGYSYQGKNNSVMPRYEFIKNTFSEDYNHEVNFKVFDVSPEIKLQLEKMAKGSFVAVTMNKYKGTGGNAAFEVFGAEAGLVLTQNVREITAVETGGAFDLILKSNENALEPHLPKTVFLTDYSTSKAIVDGLYV